MVCLARLAYDYVCSAAVPRAREYSGCTSLYAVRCWEGKPAAAARCTASLCNNYDLCAVSLVTGASKGLWCACSPACLLVSSVLQR